MDDSRVLACSYGNHGIIAQKCPRQQTWHRIRVSRADNKAFVAFLLWPALPTQIHAKAKEAAVARHDDAVKSAER
jgi:hypothetical protein